MAGPGNWGGQALVNRILIGIAGIAVILIIAVLLSNNRRAIRLRVVGAAFALQAGIAFLVLYVPAGKNVIGAMAFGVTKLLGYAQDGEVVVLGDLLRLEDHAGLAHA
eukprot:gene35076-biopygen22889